MSRVFFSLRFRLLLLVLLACAPLVALTLYAASKERRRVVAAWSEQSRRMTILADQEELSMRRQSRDLLGRISKLPTVQSGNRETCKRLLDETLANHPGYANLVVIKTNGEVLASAPSLVEPGRQTTRKLLGRVLAGGGRFATGDYVVDLSSGKPTVTFGYPLLDEAKRVQAILVAAVKLEWLGRPRSELASRLHPGATWTEMDREGTVLVCYPPQGLSSGERFPNPALVKRVLAQPDGVVEARDAEGKPAFFAFAWRESHLVPGKVATMVSVPQQVLFAAPNQTLIHSLFGIGIASGVALMLGWVGSNWLLVRPVKALVRASNRLASGALSTRTGLRHGRDELGQLTRTFDHMAQALEQRELERQLAEERLQTHDHMIRELPLVKEKLQLLSRRLVESQETERRHIARELHDEVGQNLTVAEMNLQAAMQSSRAASLSRRLRESLQAVGRVLEQVRDLSLNLRPSVLDDLGLESALRWYTNRQAELSGLQAEFRADALEGRLEPMIETACFRVAQEAFTNVVRHAHARTLTVELRRQNEHLHLSVRDDGTGFEVAALRERAVQGASLGLLSMEERATLVGGGLELKSTPGKGTEVHAWFPLKWRAPDP